MNTYLRLLNFARPFGWSIPAYLLVTILYSAFSVVNLAVLIPLLQVLFDQVEQMELTAKPEFSFTIQYFKDLFNYTFEQVIAERGKYDALKFVCGIVVVSFLASNVFKYTSEIIIVGFKTRLIKNLRLDFFKALIHMHLGYFTDAKKGDIMSKGMSDVQEVEHTITHTLKIYVREPFLLIAYFVALFSISIKLTLITLLLLPFSGGIISYIARRLKRKARQSQESLGKLNSILDEMLSGMRIIKAFNAVKQVSKRFAEEVNQYARFTFSMHAKYALSSPISEFLGIFVVVGIILIGGNMILQGSDQLNASQFITFVAIFSQILNPAKALSNAFSFLQRGIAAGERVFSIMDQQPAITNRPHAKAMKSFERDIVLEKVSFAYDTQEVLKDISLTIQKGQTVALVGPSGGGKSTLADLLPRFYEASSGHIRIDGVAVDEYDIESLRSHFGIVTQESILFNDTVFNNIIFGKQGASPEEVTEAARIANALEFIEALEHGFDTNIGEGGSKLSGGQRQRLSIARAVLANPEILILDEATSALDSESEKLVQEALQKLMQGRTSLVIAHRLSTIQNADLIVVIEKGSIVEMGKHEQLISHNGLYTRLINMQSF